MPRNNSLLAAVLAILWSGHALPAQTPTVGVISSLPGTDPGYVLFSPLASTNTYLINKQGQVLHVWHSAYLPGLVAYLRPDGKLIRAAKDHPPGSDPLCAATTGKGRPPTHRQVHGRFYKPLRRGDPGGIFQVHLLDPRRSLEMTHLCSLKVTHIENTFADTALNLFLRCERKLICPHHLLDDRVDSRQPIAYE